MLDSLYGDLPPPSKGEEITKSATPAPASGSLLGSLYDDPDEPSDAASNDAAPGASTPKAKSVSTAGAATEATSSNPAAWAAQRLKLLTPAVVRRQSMAKAAPKSSPALNVQAAAADTAVVLERLKKLHAGVMSEEHKPTVVSPLPGASGASNAGSATDSSSGALTNGASAAEQPIVNVVSVTVGNSAPIDPTTWVPVGLWPQEYDPSKPNDYSAIHREKVRQQQREELEKLRQQELEKQKLDEEAKRNGGAGDSGESPTSPEPQAPVLPSYIDPNKKTFAARMMEKMGWKQGEGLGANKQGITAPLVARKTAMRSGIIVQGQEVTSLGQVPRAVTFNMAPTRILLLLNMVGRGQVDSDLKEETEEEAAKLGNLLQVRIFEAAGVPDDCAVRIFCEYERKEEATRALLTFNGRAFVEVKTHKASAQQRPVLPFLPLLLLLHVVCLGCQAAPAAPISFTVSFRFLDPPWPGSKASSRGDAGDLSWTALGTIAITNFIPSSPAAEWASFDGAAFNAALKQLQQREQQQQQQQERNQLQEHLGLLPAEEALHPAVSLKVEAASSNSASPLFTTLPLAALHLNGQQHQPKQAQSAERCSDGFSPFALELHLGSERKPVGVRLLDSAAATELARQQSLESQALQSQPQGRRLSFCSPDKPTLLVLLPSTDPQAAVVLPPAAAPQPPPSQQQQEQQQEPQQQASLLQRYWWVLPLIVLLQFLSGGLSPEEEAPSQPSSNAGAPPHAGSGNINLSGSGNRHQGPSRRRG
ncbi:hypothetical protein Emed_000694 [Eimeria media]